MFLFLVINKKRLVILVVCLSGASGVPANSPDNARLRLEVWKAMIQLHDRGRGVLRAIGVSNFTPKHLEQIIKATGVAPALNQVHTHTHREISRRYASGRIHCKFFAFVYELNKLFYPDWLQIQSQGG